MRYMLDTNMCIYIIKKRPMNVFEKFSSMEPGDICISVVTLAELQYGVEKSQDKDRNRIALYSFLAPLEILPFESNSAICFGEIRSELEKKGCVIGSYDIMIAAHCMAEGLTLVTNNVSEFQRINGLKLENWV